ncbi:hypothetical protein [Leekyejoonella antrihumi]|uniref:DUF4383 domain-containing protein n=1 Tax=Leekyejoonella antrihumi TaxID=1660198 RepID=A0A563E1T3_9MICO|nr:hypothetical protein [Leekyejoonella antrihumi]TWP36193.1 hypothetical protein FGL98_10865 [Leekyejoonella antrihumi]
MTVLGARGRAAGPWSRDRFAIRLLAVLVAAGLGIDAVVHLSDAGLYAVPGGGLLTESHLFLAQSVVAFVVAILVLVRPGVATFTAAVLVTATAAAAVFIYTYVDVGAIGPLPDLYEPTWALPGKRISAAAEVCGALLAAGGLVLCARRRHPQR